MSRPRDADEGQLLALWRAGDASAGGRLCRRYQATLARFFRVRTSLSTDDLVQTTLLALVTSASTFRGESSVRTYLFEVARRVLYRAQRRQWVDDARTDPMLDEITLDFPPLLHCASDVHSALTIIDPVLRDIVLLFYWNDLTTREIAERLHIPEGTVSSRLRRARQQLRACLLQS